MGSGNQRSFIRCLRQNNRFSVAGFLLLRTISYFTYEMINRQSETARMAVLGSVGMDAVAPGSSGTTILPISLVKSDWKLQQE